MPDNTNNQPPKKEGFFNTLKTAAREISSEVNRARANLAPSGYVPGGGPTSPAAPATPSYRAPATLAELNIAPVASAASVPPLTPQQQAAQKLQNLLTNPWPALKDADLARHLRADAYFHPYTLGDLEFYARDILPATDPEIVSLIAAEAGEEAIVTCLTELCARSPGVYGSVGFSPRNLQEDLDAMDLRLTALLNDTPRFIAIGPIGLDANYNPAALPQQVAQFHRQLELAADFELPAVIFHRQALTQLRQALATTVLPKKLVWLKPIRSNDELELIHEINAHVVLRAELTHPKEEFYRNAVTQLLPQKLLVGSGNSLNAAHGREGQFNSAASLPDVIKVAAGCLKMPAAGLQARVNANFAHVFGPA